MRPRHAGGNTLHDSSLASQAAITDGRGSFSLHEVLVRAPRAGEVRVRLKAAGICHTDVASLSWGTTMVIGHEGAGVVALEFRSYAKPAGFPGTRSAYTAAPRAGRVCDPSEKEHSLP